METPNHQFSSRVNLFVGDTAAPSPTPSAVKAPNVVDHRVGGSGTGHRGAAGGGWPDPDSVSHGHGARWEISYIPYTCVTCRLHVRLHVMEIVTRRFSPCEKGFRAELDRAGDTVGRYPGDRSSSAHPCPEALCQVRAR